MSNEYRKISELIAASTKNEKNVEIRDIIRKEKWRSFVDVITQIICNDPRWLLDESIFGKGQVELNKNLLEMLRKNKYESLNESLQITLDSTAETAFIIRFMEVFSEASNFKYVYRGGSLEDFKRGLIGTFTFSLEAAEQWVREGFGRQKRTQPCLITLPVSEIVKSFKADPFRPMLIIAEHGYDELFSNSFDLSLKTVPQNIEIKEYFD